MILVNGRVFTGSETHPYAEALAIKGTQILGIGTSEEISSKAGQTTRRIDLAGRLVIPGINDSHMHFEADVIGTKLDFGDDPSCAHVLDILQHAVASAPPGTLLSGTIGPSAFLRPGMHARDARQNVARRPDCACDGFSSFRDAESGRGALRHSPASSGRT